MFSRCRQRSGHTLWILLWALHIHTIAEQSLSLHLLIAKHCGGQWGARDPWFLSLRSFITESRVKALLQQKSCRVSSTPCWAGLGTLFSHSRYGTFSGVHGAVCVWGALMAEGGCAWENKSKQH